jgi:hypothetical protein
MHIGRTPSTNNKLRVSARKLRLIEAIDRDAEPGRWVMLYGLAIEVSGCKTGAPGNKGFWIPVTSVPKSAG